MCGIAGISSLQWSEGPEPPVALLEAMAERIVHRGPDDSGTFVCGTTGFAHRRLSIIDLKTGRQPMCNDDGSIALVFNGEIFNYVELRDELVGQGVTFRTTSDTEVILRLYERRGISFVNDLNGQFAIAIWDDTRKRLVLLRDRIGICPLYYTVEGGRLIFGSEVKALMPAMRHSPSLSLPGLDQVLTFWSAVSPQTVFDGISELSPGTLLVLENGNIRVNRYWDWCFPESRSDFDDRPVDQLAGKLRELLIDATRIRLRSDVPVGAYLSGGLDSSVLVTLIRHFSNAELRSFSLAFEDGNLDESRFQSMLIEHLNADHSRLSVERGDMLSHLIDSIWHIETPILRTAPVPMGMLSGHVRESGYKVVLTGEGADEVLGGYDIFKESKVRQFWAKQPASEIRPLLLKRLYPYLTLPGTGQGAYLKKFFGDSLDSPQAVHFSHIPRWATTAQAKKFLSSDARATIADNALDTMLASLPAGLTAAHPFNRAQYIEAKSLMGTYLLSSQGDRMLMKNSVEGRFPFLDHRVIEFANALPPKYKMRGMNEKYLLKMAMRDLLPDAIVRRYKQPYRAPDITTAPGESLPESLRSAISESSVRRTGIFDAGKVRLLLKKVESNRRLTLSESQAFTGILTTQLVEGMFCHASG